MKKLAMVVAAALLSSGCAPLMYRGHHPLSLSPPRPTGHVHPAPPVGRWDLVMRLPQGAVVDVLTRDGTAHVGAVMGASETAVVLKMADAERPIARLAVIRVDLVDLPGSGIGAVARGAAGGALLGAGAAGLVAAVIGGDAWPPPGWLLRGGAAVGGLTGGEAALLQRRGGLVYLAPNP